MSFIFDNATHIPIFRIGINGNYYVYSKSKTSIIKVAQQIGKSETSIYLNSKYSVWVIRVKLNSHKEKLKQLFQEKE